MIVSLPWPDKRLSPNARVHWRAKAPVTRKAREDACFAALAALEASVSAFRASLAGEEPIALTVRFYPPDRRHRDDDGMVGAFKAARDGIADALQVNDRRFRPHYFFCDAEKPGRIEVEVKQKISPIGDNVFPIHACDPLNRLPPDETEAA